MRVTIAIIILPRITENAKDAKPGKENIAPFAAFAPFAILPEKARVLNDY